MQFKKYYSTQEELKSTASRHLEETAQALHGESCGKENDAGGKNLKHELEQAWTESGRRPIPKHDEK